MEHDQRVCPRCGKPAGEYRFCQSCRSHIDSLLGTPKRSAAAAGAPAQPATQVLREVARLEQALAAVSQGINERINAAVPAPGAQLDAEPPAGESAADGHSGGILDIAKLSTSTEERAGDSAQPPREVARLEDVLTVRPNDRSAAPAPPPAAPPAEAAQEKPVPEVSVAPAQEDAPEAVAPVQERAFETAAPDYVAAEELRDAFWFEVSAAGEVTQVAEAVSVAPRGDEAPAAVEADLSATASHPEADFSEAPSAQRNWLLVVCLLALLGLVAVLSGRARRSS